MCLKPRLISEYIRYLQVCTLVEGPATYLTRVGFESRVGELMGLQVVFLEGEITQIRFYLFILLNYYIAINTICRNNRLELYEGEEKGSNRIKW